MKNHTHVIGQDTAPSPCIQKVEPIYTVNLIIFERIAFGESGRLQHHKACGGASNFDFGIVRPVCKSCKVSSTRYLPVILPEAVHRPRSHRTLKVFPDLLAFIHNVINYTVTCKDRRNISKVFEWRVNLCECLSSRSLAQLGEKIIHIVEGSQFEGGNCLVCRIT